MTIEDLYTKEGWVTFNYPDGSVRVIRTTLNNNVLKHAPAKENEDSLFDLDKMKWIPIPKVEGVSLEVYENKPSLSEVDLFASRFI